MNAHDGTNKTNGTNEKKGVREGAERVLNASRDWRKALPVLLVVAVVGAPGPLFAAAPAEGNPVEEIARTFGVDWTHLGAQIVSFGIVCALLYKFAYKRVLEMLENRRKEIADGLANAEKIKAELARTESQRQEVMNQA